MYRVDLSTRWYENSVHIPYLKQRSILSFINGLRLYYIRMWYCLCELVRAPEHVPFEEMIFGSFPVSICTWYRLLVCSSSFLMTSLLYEHCLEFGMVSFQSLRQFLSPGIHGEALFLFEILDTHRCAWYHIIHILFGFGSLGHGLQIHHLSKSKQPDESPPLYSMLFRGTL